MKTTLPKEKDIKRTWYVLDATDKPAGRLAVKVANVLRGKTKAIYTPHVDTGDFVVVINAKKVKLTGSKEDQKVYKTFSGYPSGLKEVTAAKVREKKPELIIYHAVKNMLPKNKISVEMFRRLKVYAGSEHPHAAQQTKAFVW